ncbi:MAG: hypothetical protein J7M21_06750 [Planctomycetes bacterium]|nr:hypothetical protein [Planctomycetota bacterium]
MKRAAVTGCLVGLLAVCVYADRLVLTDGRTFTGKVTVDGETVLITVPYGTLRFAREQVERIELKDTPEQQFRKMLGEAPLDDPNALFNLAQWAEKNSLSRQAADLYALILKIAPDHPETRRALGYVRIGKQWLTFEQGIQQARGRLAAGSYTSLLDEILPALEQVANTKQRRQAVAELRGLTQLRARQFEAATKTFKSLAGSQESGPDVLRWSAIAEILSENPDGMYVLREAYPPAAGLLGGAVASLRPGPASLANPKVLQAALRDEAKKRVDQGKVLMAEAQKLDATDPDAAALRYAQAAKAFDRADALVPKIALSYRVELARRKIAAIRREADFDARKFDEMMEEKIGHKDLSPQAYRGVIQRLIHHLDNTREDLKRILEVARPFPRELVLEIKWAELDLTKVESMRKILAAELDGRK